VGFPGDEDAYGPGDRARGARRYGPPDQRQYLVRRGVGIAVLVLLLILVVVGIKGCLNARKERNFENYVSDLSSITAQTKQLSDGFFGRLSDPANLSTDSYEAAVNTDRGTAQGLLTNVQNLDTPDQLASAQSQLELAFTLRAEAMTGISEQMPDALSSSTDAASKADDAIAGYMRYFLASDVIYARAKLAMDGVLSDEDITIDGKTAKAPESVFLPDDRWLDPLEVSSALAALGGTKATSGVHGLGLLQTSINGNVLDPSTPATVTAGGSPKVEIQVQDQGDSEERDIVVSFKLTGGTQTIEGDTTIGKIAAGAIQTATIPISPAPEKGQELALEVTVQPVAGEQVQDNNRSSYQVTFG
jgi:hypothetical protein